MQKYIQFSKDRNREYKLKIKELKRENQEVKEEFSIALAKFSKLEGKVIRSP